jgi:ABC-type branched-subunit amino acid transport system substrate-binding protein
MKFDWHMPTFVKVCELKKKLWSGRVVGAVLLASLSVSSCSVKGAAGSVAAATTLPGGPIDSSGVALEHVKGPAGQGPASTTSPPETTVPATTIPIEVSILPAVTSTVVPLPTNPAPTAMPVPTVPKTVKPATKAIAVTKLKRVPVTVSPAKSVKTKRKRPTTTVAKIEVPQGTGVTLPPIAAAPAAPTGPVVTTVPGLKTSTKLAVAGTTCRKSQLGQKRSTSDGTHVICTHIKKKFVWIPVPSATQPPSALLAAAPGFDGKTITLGIIGTKTNPTWSNISKAISAGFEARVAAINRRGGVAGKYPIRILFKDANYDAGQTLVELGATKNQVVGYGSILGTPATEAAVPFLRENQLLASPASQEGRWAKEPNLLPVFNSYQIQAINGVAYYLEQAPGATVCAVSINGTFGDAGTEGFTFATADLGAKVGTVVQMAPIDTNAAPVLAQLAKAGCQGVVATVSPQQLVNLVMGAGRANLPFKWVILGAGFSDRIITQQTSKTFEQSCVVIGDGPMWGEKETAPLAADLIASDNRYWTENPDVGLTFGYTQARVWEAMLEAAVASGDLSRAGLLSASRSVGAIDTGGLGSPIDYRQPQRLSAPRATVYAVDGSYKNSIRTLVLAYSAPVATRFRLR